MLKSGGKFLILYMGWLPEENKIAKRSEELILKYNTDWNGCGDYRHNVWIPDEYLEYFDVTFQEVFDVQVPFTRESWQGRMKACRGVGASMTPETIVKWEEEHSKMMLEEASDTFNILHYVSIGELKVKK